MGKSLAFGVCFAVLAATQVSAADISNDTLAAMGLGDAVVVSDAVSAEVRGMGYKPYGKYGLPISIVEGSSFANVGDKKIGAGSTNGYFAAGKYGASGENFSEAGKTETSKKVVNLNGVKKSVTKTNSIHVYAGGYSSAMSF